MLVTGSKFFTGPPPPFCGALLVPPPLALPMAAVAAVPAGLSDDTSRSDWPIAWSGVRARLGERINLGQLPRWVAAAQAQLIHRALNDDVSAVLPEAATATERQLAAWLCHIGQPVAILGRDGRMTAALRIGTGARVASETWSDAGEAAAPAQPARRVPADPDHPRQDRAAAAPSRNAGARLGNAARDDGAAGPRRR